MRFLWLDTSTHTTKCSAYSWLYYPQPGTNPLLWIAMQRMWAQKTQACSYDIAVRHPDSCEDSAVYNTETASSAEFYKPIYTASYPSTVLTASNSACDTCSVLLETGWLGSWMGRQQTLNTESTMLQGLWFEFFWHGEAGKSRVSRGVTSAVTALAHSQHFLSKANISSIN